MATGDPSTYPVSVCAIDFRTHGGACDTRLSRGPANRPSYPRIGRKSSVLTDPGMCGPGMYYGTMVVGIRGYDATHPSMHA